VIPKDASYLGPANISLNLTNVSYINPAGVSSVSGVGNLQSTPFFDDIKSKKQGESKLTVPDFNPD